MMYYADSDFTIADRVVEIAQRRSVLPAQIALAWLLQQPGVVAPIIGASKLEQLDQCAGATDIRLDAEEMKYLEELYQPHKVLGHH
jgi:aryl-alcohol dehydrogenase (NADP+)